MASTATTPTIRTAARQSLRILVEHDLFRKPVSTFRDHALAQLLQHLLTQIDAVADAALGELDHFLGDHIGLAAIAVGQAERAADVGISAGHDAERFRLERLVAKQAVDGHRSALITVTDPDKAGSKVAGGSAAVTRTPTILALATRGSSTNC